MVRGIGFTIRSVIFMLIFFSKLPLFGLHIWLLKVHVEANLFTSIILARLVLKVGSYLIYLIGSFSLLFLMATISCVVIINLTDGKVIVGISSVIHISYCCLYGMLWYGRFTHVLISPLIFISVYYYYILSRLRAGWIIRLILIIINLGFPFIRSFLGEVWVSYSCLLFIVGYFLCFVFSFKILNLGYENGIFCMLLLFTCLV
jgi:hypothetical protein